MTIVTTLLNQTSIKLGESINDTETLTSGMAAPVAYRPEASTGTYYFSAIYSGDANYIGNQKDNNAEQLTVTKSAE